MASSSSGSSKTGHWTRSQDKNRDSDSEEETVADYVRHHVEKDAEESDSGKPEKKGLQRQSGSRMSKRRAKETPQEKRQRDAAWRKKQRSEEMPVEKEVRLADQQKRQVTYHDYTFRMLRTCIKLFRMF